MENNYNDLAIILAWPDATIRGDESWMMFFRKIGLVKNLNFKVGHTGVILVESETGTLLYYDFGRYISPRGLGRARSPFSDPRLRIRTKAQINCFTEGKIDNLEELAKELHEMQEATQGEGRLFFSVATGLSFTKAKEYADKLVIDGSTPYGAFARGNNNCSRFITRMLLKASKKYNFWHGVNLPESFKASPMSNVVNVRKDRMIYIYDHTIGLMQNRMNRFQSFLFLLKQLRDNFVNKPSTHLPDDRIIGSVTAKPRPHAVPENAQWLGGVGEGAWYHVTMSDHAGDIEIARYTEKGELEYSLPFYTDQPFDINNRFHIDYDSHMLHATIKQGGKQIRLYSLLSQEEKIYNFIPEKTDNAQSDYNLNAENSRTNGGKQLATGG